MTLVGADLDACGEGAGLGLVVAEMLLVDDARDAVLQTAHNLPPHWSNW